MAKPRVIKPVVYVDSDVYVDLLTKNAQANSATGEPRWFDAKRVFDAVNEDRITLAASALIEAEVGSNGAANIESERIRKLLEGWFLSPDTLRTDVDHFLAREAVRLRREHGSKHSVGKRPFGGADAIHLAAAVRLGCDYLMTHDGGMPIGHKIENVEVLQPQVVWQETLFDEAVGGENAIGGSVSRIAPESSARSRPSVRKR